MAEVVVSLALETLRNLLVEEGRFLLGVRGEVKELQNELEQAKCYLKDADKKQHERAIVRKYIRDIRDLAYKAEDVILEYDVRKSSDGPRRGLKRLLALFDCYSLHQLGSEISDIQSELSRVIERMENNGISKSIIDQSSSVSDSQNCGRKTFPSFEIEDCFVGKEDDFKRLRYHLVEDKQNRVISVWGMGGIGKTAIAKKVYNHLIETQHDRFDSFAWVCITQECRIQSVLEEVLDQLDSQRREGVSTSNLNHTQLVNKLLDIQKAKRCMIVLDDLWETSQWNELKPAFLAQKLKSKILVTTRKKNVVEIGLSQELGLLNVDDGWELLKKKAFPHNNIPEFALKEDFKRIGEEMVLKCGRLPLAISLVGGVLSRKSCMEEWEGVHEEIKEILYRGEGHDEKGNAIIDEVLKLSYEDLPFNLKPCFLYLGILKKDESIYSADLYRMWIAQGMISEENIRGNETLTDIAENYLTDLTSRCIVEVEAEDVIPLQKHKKCKLHDVVRELCLSMGEKEGFGVQILEYEGGKFSPLLHKAVSLTKPRHLAIHVKEELQLECNEHTISFGEYIGKNLRSLEILSEVKRKRIKFPSESIVDLQKAKLLRGLVIMGFKFEEGKLPRGITDLVHLRYLKLRNCELDSLPSSISNLAYLDTLDLHGLSNVRIPDHFLKRLSRLKHLLLPSYDTKAIGDCRLKLDEGVYELESLIRFDSLVHELKSTIRMKNLRRFSAQISDNQSLSTIINAINATWNKLSYSSVLVRQGCNLTANEEGLSNLKRAFSCRYLYNLRIQVKLGKLLEECIGDIIISKLVKLYLLDSEIEDDPMGILGKLPSLRDLYLDSRSLVGEEMTCPASSFPQLKRLVLQNLPNLREWRVEQGAMPVASEICLRRCYRLKSVPDGLSCLSTLKKLVITGMPKLGKRVFATPSRKEGVDFHKVSHIPSINIINYSKHGGSLACEGSLAEHSRLH